ncbi:hypothetical protein L7F22_010836 [Adiantum nelumboides]|nr:hypothetical protein [Adiantum nelumboides]
MASSYKTLKVKEQHLEKTMKDKELIEHEMMSKYLVQSLQDIASPIDTIILEIFDAQEWIRKVKTNLEDKVETFSQALVDEVLINHFQDNMDEEDDDDDGEDQQTKGTSGQGHGLDDDDDQNDPPNGTGPSSRGLPQNQQSLLILNQNLLHHHQKEEAKKKWVQLAMVEEAKKKVEQEFVPEEGRLGILSQQEKHKGGLITLLRGKGLSSSLDNFPWEKHKGSLVALPRGKGLFSSSDKISGGICAFNAPAGHSGAWWELRTSCLDLEEFKGMAASGNRIDDSGGSFRLITSAPRNRELTGAADLLSHYGLRDLHEKFCQKPLPASVGESHYLRNVVGDIEIRKGEGMELGQLLGPDNEAAGLHIHPFDSDVLQQAFTLRESGPISLPEASFNAIYVSLAAFVVLFCTYVVK